MYDTSGTHSVCHATAADNDTALRIDWLKGEVARAENRDEALRAEAEWERAASMRSPVTTEDAYAWFGTFLGLFPPFAMFAKAVAGGMNGRSNLGDTAIFWLCLLMAMNAVCCLVGRKFGRVLGRSLGDPRAHGWFWYVVFSLLVGGAWAVVTGAAGGALGFGIGAIFGIFFAMPVALTNFPVFAVLHRIQSHGGMIEERDLWPIAFGIPLATAALIMSLGR
ncbi:MAG TPA: hypothetical protein VM936_22105 [Pyrinomonadaceae bacterium]|jgi:hypothetical protein|nr:hypothetical protein [Pyrinomonadaceae bacterium]